jgi:tripartite-type tricarboxylate transporter receptor subunit TctC
MMASIIVMAEHAARLANSRPEEHVVAVSRRRFVKLAAAAAAFTTVSPLARAQPWPSRPVRIIVGFAAGGPNDILARLIGQYLSERLGQPFVVDNRPGAGSNVATEAVVRAAPDGYTLLLAGSPNAINASLYENLKFDFIRDIAPVAGLLRGGLVMLVHPGLPAGTLPEFIDYAKTNPGKLSYGSGGVGGITHITAELFKMMAGVDMVHVPYRGVAPALTDLLGGQVQVLFANPGQSISHVKDGKLRSLAITTGTRLDALPDLPAIAEFVAGYEASSVFGLGAPRNTPAETIDKLNKEINAALADPKLKARLAELDGAVLGGSPADFGRLMAGETEKWGRVVRFANIRVD